MSASPEHSPGSFDHGHLTAMPEYKTLQRAISGFARAASFLGERELVQAVTDTAEGMCFAESCPRCGNGPAVRLTAPFKLDTDPESGTVTCAYRCARCASTWTASYIPADDPAPELAPAPIRKADDL